MVCVCLSVSAYKHWQKIKRKEKIYSPADHLNTILRGQNPTQFNILCYFRSYLWHLSGAFLGLTSVAKTFGAVGWSPPPEESTVRRAPAVLWANPGTSEEDPSVTSVCFGVWWEPFAGMLTWWKMGEGRFMNKARFTVLVILCFPH